MSAATTPEQPVNRPLDAVLETPLTAYEIGYRMAESGHITGRVVMTEDDMAQDNGSAEEGLSSSLIGNFKLIDISHDRVGTKPSWKYSPEELADPSLRENDFEDDLIIEVTGGIDSPYDHFGTDGERENYQQGYNDAQRLVRIIDLNGQNYEDAVDAINDMGGSTGAAVEYLSQWDVGQETDSDAAVIDNYTSRNHVERLACHREEHGGINYWLIADHSLRHYVLYRRPLDSI